MLKNRSYAVPVENARKGQTSLFRHPLAKDGFLGPRDLRRTNMQQQLLAAFDDYPEQHTLGNYNEGSQQYDQLTYNEIKQITRQLGSGLLQLNAIQEVQDDRGLRLKPIGIFLRNRREWTLIDIACCLFGLVSVPFYDTSSKDTIKYGFETTNTNICFIENNTANTLCDANLQNLQCVISVDKLSEQTVQRFRNNNVQVIEWQQLLENGQQQNQAYPQIDQNSICTVVFTSGTTGQPKAAAQTHKNLVYMISTFDHDTQIHITQNDTYLSYLPLAHTFERILHLAFFSNGGQINYYSGDKHKLNQDIQRCRPTFFGAVPRIFNRFYESIQQGINNLENQQQKDNFNRAVQEKLFNLRKTGSAHCSELDSTVFSKTRSILGGRQKCVLSAGAPISSQILDFLKVTLCTQIYEAYGQTETCGASFLTDYYEGTSGNVGGPTVSQEFKLVDVPEMGYWTTDQYQGNNIPRGEICIRGPTIFAGYFRDSKSTQEVIDHDGFCHTGDIGQILQNGALQIIDRKKNIFKLQQGEYVAPEWIENCYNQAQGVSECLVLGNSLKQYCVGIVVVEQQYLQKQAQELNLQGNQDQWCNNKQLRRLILNNCNQQGTIQNLRGFEQIRNVHLEHRSFSELGLLTETLKKQRQQIYQHYNDTINQLYEEGQL